MPRTDLARPLLSPGLSVSGLLVPGLLWLGGGVLTGCQLALEAEGPIAVPADSPSADPATLDPRGYLAYRSPGPIVVDGRLDDPAWVEAPRSSLFRDIQASTQPAPTWPTWVKMLWDDDYLYIGAHLVEPDVWATLTEHDAVIFQDHDFEVFIDPDGDRHQYYEYEINALGTDWDLRLVKPYLDGGPALNEWEIPGLQKGVHVEGTLNDPSDRDEFWSVELALPWSALAEFAGRPCPPRDRDQWRMGFSRVEWDVQVEDGRTVKIPERPEHNWTWTDQGAINMHLPEHWGYVQFSTALPGQSRYRVDPAREARALLARVHHAQLQFREREDRFAEDLGELGIDDLPEVLAASVLFDVEVGRYEASLAVAYPGGRVRRIFICEDGRMTERD